MYNSNKSSVPLICVLSVKLDSHSCTFTSISFLTNYINRLYEILMMYQWLSLDLCMLFQDPLSQFFLANLDKDVWALGQLWSWSYDSWIYNYLWNQSLSPLKLWVRILIRRGIPDTTLSDKVCQWLATGRWFSPDTLFSSTNKTDRHVIAEILLKVALNTITP
jgi:hypothetical protein